MLQLLPCPHCGQQSLLPHDTSLEASLKCPHCGQQLVLGEALIQQFSSWEIVEDPAAVVTSQGPSSQLSKPVVIPVPQGDSPHEELHLADSPTANINPPATQVNVRPYTHFEYERMRRKQKSPIRSVLPVVLGGLAAFPIALLILWHGLGKDVGDMGPRVAEYAPWIVPRQFHPVSKFNPSLSRQPPQSGDSGLPQLSDFAPEPTPAPALPDEQVNGTAAMDTLGDKVGDTTNDLLATPSAEGKLKLAPEATAEPASESTNTTTQVAPNQNSFATIRETKELLIQLEKAMKSASADRISLLSSVFDRLARLAVDFGNIDRNNLVHRTIIEQMQPIARIIKQNADLQTVIDKFLERMEISPTSSAPIGIAMTLEITEAERLQELWMIVGNHKLPAKSVIEIPRTLAPNLTAGQRLLVLGVLVPADPNDAEATPLLRVSYLHSL